MRWRRPADVGGSGMDDIWLLVSEVRLASGGCEKENAGRLVGFDRCSKRFLIRIFVDFSWCSLRICILSSAREVSVCVPILFLSLVSVTPNTLNNRSQVAEFAMIERSRSARRKKDVGGHPGNSNSCKTANGSGSCDCESELIHGNYTRAKTHLAQRPVHMHGTYCV